MSADICLILEGSYPFVAGGVSSWVHNIIKGLPHLTFTAVCILPSAREPHPYKYELPPNFIPPEVLYIHDVDKPRRSLFRRFSSRHVEEIRAFHKGLASLSHNDLVTMIDAFRQGRYPLWDLMHGKPAWDLLIEQIQERVPDAPFMNYFWTFRFTHLPMFKAMGVRLPEAKAYHAISTGYAGLIGTVARIRTGRPLLLTEHGIYTKERKIEIAQSEALQQNDEDRMRISKDLGLYQQLWVRLFYTLGRITYRYAERIVTLYEGNRQMQIKDGADQWRTEVIPNGIDLEGFQNLKPADYPPEEQDSFIVGFVGRVVPIKDVKTFIRACKAVSLKFANVQFWIMGPTEEDEEYYEECIDLVKILQMQDKILFLGRINVREYYPKLDMVVLTSISEAQPLVVMEANCAGIPVVASDVGACRELLEGRLPEDKALGPSGVITRVANPADTAAGMLGILTNYPLRKRMTRAGRERIARYYSEASLNARYDALYKELMEMPQWHGPGGTDHDDDEEGTWQV
ncbi:GT4 family glycosyltransferase PelF [Desulfovibrio psychrotolerans]|uniref:Pellicle/biofilm biosynthesis glycosyltransferase PelF n=1 Tax=Desulfovibrio psychrotolerans TaxID=415242 RepID=A0A7J0BQI0_9BACT|nr:GT4 family glycosyltransferase PelF [Desulfovibrio psychrotolerans]GFM35324.1 pellicle/biofilm biosynthesis glycosyltransferase PelF [Desulfovibrio psychrotolerans]